MSVDREYRIKIISEANGAAAQQTAQGLKEVGTATEKVSEANEDGAKHAEHSGLSHAALHKILHLIAHESGPGAGAAIAGIAAATQGSMMIATMAVRELFVWIERVKQEAEEAVLASAEVWIKQRDSINDAATAAEDFAKGLEHAKDATKELQGKAAQEKAVLEAQIEGHKKLLEAIENEQIAEANGDKDKIEKIQERFADLKREYDITAEILKLEQQRASLARLEKQQGPLAAAAAAAEKSKEASIGNQGAAELKARVDSQDEKKLKAAYDAALAEKISYYTALGMPEEAAKTQALGDNNEDIQNFVAYENDRKALEAHEKKLKQLTEAADQSIKARDRNKDAIEEQTRQIERDTAVSEEHQKTARGVKAVDDVNRLGGVEKFSQQYFDSITRLNQGKGSAGDEQTRQLFVTLLQATKESDNQTFTLLNAIISDLIAHKQTTARTFDDIQRRFDRPRQ